MPAVRGGGRHSHGRGTCSDLSDFRRLVLPLEPLTTALDGRDELREVHLEGVEDLVRVILRAEPDLPLPRPRVLDDVLRRTFRLLGHFLLGDELRLPLARLL